MHILIAPNAFKHSLSAIDAARAIEDGLLQSKLRFSARRFPVGDGGDGTAELLLQHACGERIWEKSIDPLGRQIQASYGWVNAEKTAIIELAEASGLHLLRPNEYDPLHANTRGTGRLIRAALEKNARRIILCIGGSATIDAAAGILEELGIRLLSSSGNLLEGMPANFANLDGIDIRGMDKRIEQTEMIVLCDVENTLLGASGTAAVFGPQKGASPAEVLQLESLLSRFSEKTLEVRGKDMRSMKGGGAAGGVAAALAAYCDATLVSGIDYFLDQTGFLQELKKADLVITGEGSIDAQTLDGKGPFGVAARAKQLHLSVIGLAGRVPQGPDPELEKYFDLMLSIQHEALPMEEALPLTASNLQRTAAELGNLLASDSGRYTRNY